MPRPTETWLPCEPHSMLEPGAAVSWCRVPMAWGGAPLCWVGVMPSEPSPPVPPHTILRTTSHPHPPTRTTAPSPPPHAHNASPFFLDSHYNSALHLACGKGSLPATKLLLEAGASRTVVSKGGFTPADRAAITGHKVPWPDALA